MVVFSKSQPSLSAEREWDWTKPTTFDNTRDTQSHNESWYAPLLPATGNGPWPLLWVFLPPSLLQHFAVWAGWCASSRRTTCKEREGEGRGRKENLKKVKRNKMRQLQYFSTLRRVASVMLQWGTTVGEMKINSAYSSNEVNSRVGWDCNWYKWGSLSSFCYSAQHRAQSAEIGGDNSRCDGVKKSPVSLLLSWNKETHAKG